MYYYYYYQKGCNDIGPVSVCQQHAIEGSHMRPLVCCRSENKGGGLPLIAFAPQRNPLQYYCYSHYNYFVITSYDPFYHCGLWWLPFTILLLPISLSSPSSYHYPYYYYSPPNPALLQRHVIHERLASRGNTLLITRHAMPGLYYPLDIIDSESRRVWHIHHGRLAACHSHEDLMHDGNNTCNGNDKDGKGWG